MDQILWIVGGTKVTLAMVTAGGVMLAGLLLLWIAIAASRAASNRKLEATERQLLALELEQRMGEVARIQSEMTGRMQNMGDMFASQQSELARSVSERLDSVTHRLGQSMEATTNKTTDNLRHLYERLALIDNAQKNISDLSTQVTSLREVLANKQARGAFGQARMEAIVRDGLPSNAYAFQHTLSNGLRPDCVVFLPDERPLVIDSKFPLEAITAFGQAKSDDERKRAGQRLRADLGKHVGDVARYLIPGETQEMALIFVPSESVYAELHDAFDDIVQKAYRSRVVLVSPALLMLAIQVVQQIQKDARMREAASQIQTEVGHLMQDLGRLNERVVNLQRHFGQANEDVRQIMLSRDKIEKRATRINELDFEEPREAGLALPRPLRRDAAE
ncbi:DNA recombination protein RmuC [Variibacter gotjawalensis]|uniref:DNA recombination protein RmuC homolog n=1 Tax=Variibacter gotjawalensis TaxID=1333996 RepID=A0A0S3PP06_9BRAD|nr:DNA recombination protein RmuC [Variibacter gotjawalensis]NIK47992.1 DNA recombination protein RmuC [Variibacter gotjawalensis]RZS49869.1 DNA recombination protein RmuC [Variibacter gotjawalensis]BAT57698.1 DNA recombination protein RmuC [Variibacter gotjawalensis]